MDDGKPTPVLAPRSPGRPNGRDQEADASVIARLDARIADSATPIREAIALTRIRQELLQQDEGRLDRAALRTAASRQLVGKVGFSAVAIVTGIWFTYTSHEYAGFVLLGVGFYWLAPDFVMRIYSKILDKDNADAK